MKRRCPTRDIFFLQIRLICTPFSPFCGDYHVVNFGDKGGGGKEDCIDDDDDDD